MSNLFLPGFWPHAALCVGGDLPILEAKKDGVKFRPLSETLTVDAFLILRPKIAQDLIDSALERARTHEGKLYDFVFDFSAADRLVCSEVIYRAYNGVDDISFELIQRSGRMCLPAEELLKQAMENGWFDLLLCYGVKDDELLSGEEAQAVVIDTLE